MKSNKRALLANETLGLVLGAAVVAILVILFFAIFSPMFDKERETGKSYINSLKGEIAKVDSGGVGSFKMIFLRDSDKERVDSYLVYFNGTYGMRIREHAFLAPTFDKNLLCVCTWSEKARSVCGSDQCTPLKAPAILKESSGNIIRGKWGVVQDQNLKITFEGGKYVFEKVA